jgi:hypothetical protein
MAIALKTGCSCLKQVFVGAPTQTCRANSIGEDMGSCGFGLWFEREAVAEASAAAFEIGEGSVLADLVEIGVSELAVRQAFGEHMVGADEDLVGDGERCAAELSALSTIARAEAPTNRPAPPPFSSIIARHRRWSAA